MKRFKLRNFLIVVTVLPALLGMLWRCGQIEYWSSADFERSACLRCVRICRLELRIDTGIQDRGISAGWVRKWIHKSVLETYPQRAWTVSDRDEKIRDRHPWNSREWSAFYSTRLFTISVGEQFAKVPAPKAPDLSVFSAVANRLINLPADLMYPSDEPIPTPPAP